MDPMQLTCPQFLDLVDHYRLTVQEPAAQDQMPVLSAAEPVKPLMQTEAARKIPVPSWWTGTSVSDANFIASKIRGKA